MLAGCLGVYARHCTPPELAALLKGGGFAPASASRSERLGHALTLASVAQYAPERWESSPVPSSRVCEAPDRSRVSG